LSAAHGESLSQHVIIEDLDEDPADDEILIDLRALDPRGLAPPLGNEIGGDHGSVW
jgi:hypothetical protein